MMQRVTRWTGYLVALFVGAMVAPLAAQAIVQLSNGTFAQKVLLADNDGNLAEVIDGFLKVFGPVTIEPGVTPIDVIIEDSATLDVQVTNGSATVTEDRNIPASTASVAQTATTLYGYNGSTNVGYWADPCETEDKTTTPISITADTVVIAATSAKKNYVCGITVVAAAAEIVSLTEGTGSTCATNEAAIVGSTTDANGMSFAANGGWAKGDGSKTVYAGKTANSDTCLNVSGSNRVAGEITWVQR